MKRLRRKDHYADGQEVVLEVFTMGQTEFTGPDIEKMKEVRIVRAELAKLHIFLEGFGISITKVYTKPQPFGFDFDCGEPQALLRLARKQAALSEDKTDTLGGRISAYVTSGVGLRQIGSGPRLHLEIDVSTGKCNAHIDSHGYTVGDGKRDLNLAMEHGYWDLAPSYVPFLYRAWGERGQAGPMARPMVGLDGRTNIIFGIHGIW